MNKWLLFSIGVVCAAIIFFALGRLTVKTTDTDALIVKVCSLNRMANASYNLIVAQDNLIGAYAHQLNRPYEKYDATNYYDPKLGELCG